MTRCGLAIGLMALAAAFFLPGCAGLPARGAAPVSTAATDVDQTRLAQVAAAATPEGKRGLSGFRLLPEGETAFNARIALARRAAKTLDAQYYLIQNDDVGQQFLRELRDAALRGVRGRLLVDDLYTGGEDELLAGLAAVPNVEVRIFNPLPARAVSLATRFVLSLHQFGRINHRCQVELMRRYRAVPADKHAAERSMEKVRRGIHLSINGIAAGSRNAG